ncbi:MAG: hypothetical protein AAB795_01710 [Patescibacteria group bacterium]
MTIEEKAKKCGELLAISLLDEEIKKIILEGIGNFTEGDLDRLMFSLEQEDEHLGLTASQLTNFDKEQDKGWDQLVVAQKKKADEIVSDFSRQIEKNVQDKIREEIK